MPSIRHNLTLPTGFFYLSSASIGTHWELKFLGCQLFFWALFLTRERSNCDLVYKAIIKETNSSVDLLCLCLKSSDLHVIPHELNVKLFMENDTKKINCKCSCPSGSLGQFKHSVTVLLYLHSA